MTFRRPKAHLHLGAYAFFLDGVIAIDGSRVQLPSVENGDLIATVLDSAGFPERSRDNVHSGTGAPNIPDRNSCAKANTPLYGKPESELELYHSLLRQEFMKTRSMLSTGKSHAGFSCERAYVGREPYFVPYEPIISFVEGRHCYFDFLFFQSRTHCSHKPSLSLAVCQHRNSYPLG